MTEWIADNSKPDNRMEERLYVREDIEWIAQPHRSKWIARDPLSGAFYYFSEMEYWAAKLLGSTGALDAVVQKLQQKFPGVPLTRAWLLSFASRLHSAHLLAPSSPRIVDRLTRTAPRSFWQQLLRTMAIPLTMRVPLFNPNALLNKLRWVAWILFNPITFALALVAAVVAGALVLGRLLSSSELLAPGMLAIQGDRWILLLLSYIVVKSLHELGHTLACARYRVDCQEIGLLFLFFTPCFYCDTTESWKLPSRWNRAAIAAAGMYVEMMLATLAAFVWILTQEESILHAIASSVMLVCSVGTIFLNGNPFLRYDGYYILSDVWNVPNLSDQSRDALWSLTVSALTGKRVETSYLDANVFALAAFALASTLYRIFLSAMILWIAWSTLVPLGLGFIAINIMLIYLVGMVVSATRLTQSTYRDLMLRGSLRFGRLVLLLSGLMVAIYYVLAVPVSTYVAARAVADFADKTPLFAPATGELVEVAEINAPITVSQPLLKFDSPEKRMALVKIKTEQATAKEQLAQAEARVAIDEAVTFEIPAIRETIADMQSKIEVLERELNSLTLRASQPGMLLPSNFHLNAPIAAMKDDLQDLDPLSIANRGCTIERGTLVGWFSPQSERIVTAVVSQEDVRLLAIGMEAECRFDSQFHSILTGKVLRISPEPIRRTPDELQGDPQLISVRNAEGVLAPQIPHYEVTIALNDPNVEFRRGSLASVRFKIASRTIIESIERYLRLNFKPIY